MNDRIRVWSDVGQEPRNAGSLQNLKKVRKQIAFQSLQKEWSPADPFQTSDPQNK